MAKSAILYSNLAAGLTPTGTSSSAAAGFPWSNLDDPQPRIRARVTATSAILVFDLGSAMSADTWAFISTTLPVGATVRIRASTADPTCVASLLLDTGVQSAVTDPVYNGNVIACFASTSARYWRADFASATNPIDIGRAPLGLLFRPGRNYQYGAQEGVIDLSVRDTNPDTGAAFGVSGPKLRTKLLTFTGLTPTEVRDTLAKIDRDVGASGDVLFVDDPDAAWLTRARDAIWGSYRQAGPALATRQGAQIFARSMRLTERL
jgi:hypothetical protein